MCIRDRARQDYARAVEIDPSLGDYYLYQEAFVRGLQRDYNGKVQTLNRLISDYPESQYMDDALYEQGRAFVQMEDNANAIARFNILVKKFPESNVARRAANEIGLLYYQDDKYPEACLLYTSYGRKRYIPFLFLVFRKKKKILVCFQPVLPYS